MKKDDKSYIENELEIFLSEDSFYTTVNCKRLEIQFSKKLQEKTISNSYEQELGGVHDTKTARIIAKLINEFCDKIEKEI
jgi:hypothetical protein